MATCATLRGQLLTAFEASGLTWPELLTKTGFTFDQSVLRKKLRGGCRLNTDEAEIIARELNVTIVWPPPRSRSRRLARAA